MEFLDPFLEISKAEEELWVSGSFWDSIKILKPIVPTELFAIFIPALIFFKKNLM